ncbi:MAG TPA: hypothetical protein PLS90_00110 [Candidatus Sumerlaeota bacterium]|nr:hypothetical protein [Candidatus Sumerlaeota bacterium]HOR26451.1 hypothetical protein [Candidatus Sumerlaeota bacterium]HPK00835.1 hypothetical protein [Candidatus Sumerlaeota bacterium]
MNARLGTWIGCALALLAAGGGAWAQEMGAPPPAFPPPDFAMPAAEAPPPRDTLGTELADDVIVQYDPETDSIIVITDQATHQQIQQVIETLDRPVPQVLIKVLFLEVTHSNDLDLGVEAAYIDNDENDAADSVMTDFGVDAAALGGFYRILDEDLRVTMRALASVGKLEVLSRPSVLARNNETATITIGQEVPFIRNTRITDNGQTINTIEYEDIGIILQVTPHITPERLVEMEVLPEISTLTADTVPISETVNARVIAKRSAQTRVVVADGKTVVIGGLMEDQETESVNKVPILGDIPLLGAFFRRTVKEKTKTELLIFLTPYVVDGQDALDRLTVAEHQRTEITPHALTEPGVRAKYLEGLPPRIETAP